VLGWVGFDSLFADLCDDSVHHCFGTSDKSAIRLSGKSSYQDEKSRKEGQFNPQSLRPLRSRDNSVGRFSGVAERQLYIFRGVCWANSGGSWGDAGDFLEVIRWLLLTINFQAFCKSIQ